MVDHIRKSIRQNTLRDEAAIVAELAAATALDQNARDQIARAAADLVRDVRALGNVGIMEQFLSEYGLSTKEGVALMCLAEAMLRVPDSTTVDELIKDKIAPHDWSSHLGQAGSILVNASTWGLMLTGRVIDQDGAGLVGTLHGVVRRLGEPVVRTAVRQAMAEMGNQFVLGQTIQDAMDRGAPMVAKGYSYSYDMLGEAARTESDARRYHQAYRDAIAAIADVSRADNIRDAPGISVKLSALHPRYEMSQRDAMLPTLSARLLHLARAAKAAGIGLNIDAEEADRLDLSLDVIKATLSDPSLAGWDGFGVVVQAYGRRALPVLDWLYALANDLDRKIMVRLVKGAYWDTEIKRAQVMGLNSFPVFTRKCHTDVSYLACAQKLLSMGDRIYSQFATHNAHSAAAVLHMAGDDTSGFEFQRLHGMGEALHDILKTQNNVRCRIYAPVGAHQDLLAYLVRRLLENGANGSFVNQLVDHNVPPEMIARDPITAAGDTAFTPNPKIETPDRLFAPRDNSQGWDLTDEQDLGKIEAGRARFAAPYRWQAKPLTPVAIETQESAEIFNPANGADCVGTVVNTPADMIGEVVQTAVYAHPAWQALPVAERAEILRKVGDLYQENTFEFLALATREAGKTLLDGVAEIREAVDFLRYYAAQLEQASEKPARGVIVCISPWNFPLAIFTGQIAAALAAGNAVIAKPAEQTPLIAFRAVQLMHAAGVPADVLQLLPGDGVTVGAPLCADPRINGVCFTGSTEVAQIIDRQLSQSAPAAMLIAETGGMNAMIVDSTALIEQAVRDIVRSAFQSAGQRCSALRVLYVQKDVEPELLDMLAGAMDVLQMGDPWFLSTDVGPVIDCEAYEQISGYLKDQEKAGNSLKSIAAPDQGLFVPPTVLRSKGIAHLEREVFGPVLHLVSFDANEIDAVVDAINARGYGLTFGLHTRIDNRVQRILDRIHVGNVYVNRDQIGAIVGSQPFGGHGLSGTGPKAGGPQYLPRFFAEPGDNSIAETPVDSVDAGAIQSALSELTVDAWAQARDRIPHLRALLRGKGQSAVSAAAALDFGPIDLPGPTGESNQYRLAPRGIALCLGPDATVLLAQVIQALAAGNSVVAVADKASETLSALACDSRLPLRILDGAAPLPALAELPVDLVAFAGSAARIAELRQALARRAGPILPLVTSTESPAAYTVEQTICIDTTAAGGNASLLAAAGG